MQRTLYNGEPVYLGNLFRLTKGSKKSARAALSSHELGWQLRLVINDDVRHAQVCTSEEEVLATADQWKAALFVRGWGVKKRRAR
jgi:hypothetical protein